MPRQNIIPPKKGERRGGRKKGTPNNASQARQAEITKSGYSPLDVMVKAYRRFQKRVETLDRKALRTKDIEEKAKLIKEADDAQILASAEASKAAHYVHPKLAMIQSKLHVDATMTLEMLVTASLQIPANSNLLEGPVIEAEEQKALPAAE